MLIKSIVKDYGPIILVFLSAALAIYQQRRKILIERKVNQLDRLTEVMSDYLVFVNRYYMVTQRIISLNQNNRDSWVGNYDEDLNEAQLDLKQFSDKVHHKQHRIFFYLNDIDLLTLSIRDSAMMISKELQKVDFATNTSINVKSLDHRIDHCARLCNLYLLREKPSNSIMAWIKIRRKVKEEEKKILQVAQKKPIG
jgi:hypothetical protein